MEHSGRTASHLDAAVGRVNMQSARRALIARACTHARSRARQPNLRGARAVGLLKAQSPIAGRAAARHLRPTRAGRTAADAILLCRRRAILLHHRYPARPRWRLTCRRRWQRRRHRRRHRWRRRRRRRARRARATEWRAINCWESIHLAERDSLASSALVPVGSATRMSIQLRCVRDVPRCR